MNVENVSIEVKWSTAPMYILNSIKMAFLARHSLSVTVSGQVQSFSPEMDTRAYGSSTTGTPIEIDTLDGQPTLLNPVLTLFDQNGKEFQYQVQNALFSTDKASLKNEGYTVFDFTIEAIDIKLLYTA
ncbi:MAG: hypothetical protein ACYDBV_14235 [Nitrospiria bacterium]